MGYNFLAAEVDQGFLLPPDMRDWLEPGHLVFTVMDAVAQFDLSRFRRGYRSDGRGGAAYDPQLMVGLLLFAYCEGVKSSRQIERRCARDVAYRVLCGNRQPDHATIARFRDRHQVGLRELFVQVLQLCAEVGLVRVGLVAIDGTKLDANASRHQNYDLARLDKAIAAVDEQIGQLIVDAQARDAAEDAAARDRDEPPSPDLRDRQRRLDKLRAAKQRLESQAADRVAVQQQRQAAWDAAAPHRGGSRPADKVPDRAHGNGKTNLTDPDSKIMKTQHGFRQSYNAQAVVTDDQVIVGAEIVAEGNDFTALHPMLDAARDSLDAAGVAAPIRVVVADAGYASRASREQHRPPGNDPIQLVDVPGVGGTAPKTAPAVGDGSGRVDPRPGRDPSLRRMLGRLASPAGQKLYARRKIMVEPVFGQIKTLNGSRVHHRGRDAVTTEWKMMAAAHNMLKYWRHTTALAV